ncbi:c-type cytochrome domain-containing protein [Novipirellula aureliae]|nr:c-type cytochrome domain-containing protein [Novipirellula aureliae]
MKFRLLTAMFMLASGVTAAQISSVATAQEFASSDRPTLEQLKAEGAFQSSYRKSIPQTKTFETPQSDLNGFRAEIEPALKQACYDCHGSENAEGDMRIDTLDPDLLHGEDISWWLVLRYI